MSTLERIYKKKEISYTRIGNSFRFTDEFIESYIKRKTSNAKPLPEEKAGGYDGGKKL